MLNVIVPNTSGISLLDEQGLIVKIIAWSIDSDGYAKPITGGDIPSKVFIYQNGRFFSHDLSHWVGDFVEAFRLLKV